MTFTVTLSGDSILNRRVSDIEDARFKSIMEDLRNADVSYTHLETLIHNYDEPEVYPSAEAGWTWMRSPSHIVDELRWMGIDVVSTASNHALDYGVGGLRSTWEALNRAGIAHAGSGEDLGAARAPTLFERRGHRIALVSMTTSLTRAGRAGGNRSDMRGRPGANPLGYFFEVDDATFELVHMLALRTGRWLERVSATDWLVNPPGLHNSWTRYRVTDGMRGARMVADERDLAGNLSVIRDAGQRADLVMVHIHNHEWDPNAGLESPPSFVREAAKCAIDAGANLVIAEGSHAPLRGAELYGHGVILYDPGDLFLMSASVTRFPHDFYERHRDRLNGLVEQATQAEAWAAREKHDIENPAGGYRSHDVNGGVVVRCRFSADLQLEKVELVPFDWELQEGEREKLPRRALGESAQRILSRLDGLSHPFGTRVLQEHDVGLLKLASD